MAIRSLVSGMSRREKMVRRVFFAGWIGMNVVLIYGPDWWHEFTDPKPRVSWAVRRQFRIRVWPATNSAGSKSDLLSYRVLEPVPSNGPQPLLLFLHGSGQRGSENESQLFGLPSQLISAEWRKRCPGFVIAPQCPRHSDWQRELPALVSLIEAWRNDPRVDRKRIYVTGFSMGGYGTWYLAAAKPEWFAAAIPICGGGDPASASQLIEVPIWAMHGDADVVVPVEQSRSMIDAIKAAGGDPQYTELPGVGHDSWTETYRDPNGVLAWMYQQVNTRCEECK